ncbi:MAG: fructosamine kinase family protein [Bacteroidota bacterium]
MQTIISQIAKQENLNVTSVHALSGGDINEVYLLEAANTSLVLKLNKEDLFPDMFRKEAEGLEALYHTQTFQIPNILGYGEVEQYAYLLLDYLPPVPVIQWTDFGYLLAQLHRHSAPTFGFPSSNYIGQLVQYNKQEQSANTFLINQRLEPQFRMAQDNGFSFKNLDLFYAQVESLIPDEQPALLHGDLWNGNCLHTDQGFALIDPAISYGPREMDLAMMQLFGGFPTSVFTAYEASYPTAPELEKRIPIYQLYYLLAHLNMFGSSYYGSCQRIVERVIFNC